MKIGKIELNSPAEVEKDFADLVYFQGCTRRCCYCFNPEMRSKGDYQQEMNPKEIAQFLYNSFSSVVVLTGGEPLDQDIDDLQLLIQYLQNQNKKVLVETSKYHKNVFATANHIMYCIKTWDIDEQALIEMRGKKNVTIVVITDHPCFDFKGYINALDYLDDVIYYRPVNDLLISKQWANLYKLAKSKKIKLKRWKKICLTKQNSTK